MGKDSTALLWLMRKAFLGVVPMPVVLLDTGMELPEVYAFRDRIAREWNLDLRVEVGRGLLSGGHSRPLLRPATRIRPGR